MRATFLHYFNSMLPRTPTSCTYYHVTEQLMVDIERLTSDRANLLSRLQHCEEDLKTANDCEHSFN